MEIITNYLTKNDCYNDGRWIDVKELILHSVGVNQPSASVFVKSWNRSGLSACVHGFIDDEQTIITLPCWEESGRAKRSWNAGTGWSGKSANNYTISFEMCEPAEIHYEGGASFSISEEDKPKAIEYVKKVTANAVEIFAQLCKFHNLDPLTQITSHSEAYIRGDASNHGDVSHLFRQLGLQEEGYTMDNFRLWVKNRLDELNNEDDEDMTQDKFNELMNNYLTELSNKEPGSWSLPERTWAESNKIIKGVDEAGKKEYMSACTREDMVVFLKRLYDLIKNEG